MSLTIYSVSEAVGATEWSMTTDTSGPDAQTTEGSMQGQLDVSDMVAGDELRIRMYDKIASGGAQFCYVDSTLTGPQSSPFVLPAMFVKHGWDVTCLCVLGTSITVVGSIRLAAL